jgi:hypothetical protein
VYLRGALGLPDLHLLPRSAKIGPRSPTAIKVFSGLVTWAAAYLVMLAAVSFLMDANPSLGYIVLWAGLPLGPLLGILVATRIALADPLPELYE